MTVLYLSRGAWGARTDLPRLGRTIDPAGVRGIVNHHTVIPAPPAGDMPAISEYMRALQTVRPDLGLDVPYSFVVFAGRTVGDGIVCEGRGFTRSGAHTAGHNYDRYGVAFGADTRTDPVTDGMIAGVRYVGARIHGTPVPTTGHRDHKATACPGPGAYRRLGDMQPPFVVDVPHELDDGDDMQTALDTTSGEGWVIAAGKARPLTDVTGWLDSWDGPTVKNHNMRHVIGDLFDIVG